MRRYVMFVVAAMASACVQPEPAPGGLDPDPAFAACDERVWTGDYGISSQADLDALAPYTVVTGSVVVEGSDLTAVAGPGCLRSIAGDLWFRTRALVSVSGFDGLVTIGGRVRVGNQLEEDPAVAVSGFDALQVIAGDAYVINTAEVRGFGRLERVGGTLRFGTGEVEVLGMNALREVGSLRFTEVAIRGLDGLTSLKIVTGDLIFVSATLDVATTGLGELTTIGGMLYWEYGVLGQDGLAAFRAIETIGDALAFTTMTGPRVMDGFPELATVGRHLAFDGVAGVERIRGFDELCSTGPLSFEAMDDLTKIDGFPGLERVDGLMVAGNDQLQSVTLRDLEAIHGDLIITGNPSLTALNLPGLGSLAGAFTITRNPMVPRCRAQALLDVLRAHGYSGPARIEDNGPGTCE